MADGGVDLIDVARGVDGVVEPGGETREAGVARIRHRRARAQRHDAQWARFRKQSSSFEHGDGGGVVARDGAVDESNLGVDVLGFRPRVAAALVRFRRFLSRRTVHLFRPRRVRVAVVIVPARATDAFAHSELFQEPRCRRRRAD